MSNLNGIYGSPLLHTLMAQTDGVNSAKDARAGGAGAAGSTPTRDSAEVSTAASALLKSSSGEDVRTEKVAAIQKAMAEGTYSVSASDVADKLMQNLLGNNARG